MSFYKKVKKHPFFAVLLIFLAAFSTRLPRLLSPHLFLNGDEAIVGIMAQNLLTEGQFPLFFLGQNYGLSTLEALLIAPFLHFLGACDVAVKIPMLLLFATGCCLMYFFVKRLFSVKVAILAIVLFLILPSWLLWSMQARGGYLTAFVVYNALLLSWTFKQHKIAFIVLNVVLLLLIYLSQPLWLVAIIPFVGMLALERKKWLLVAFVIFLLLGVCIPLLLPQAFWVSPSVNLIEAFQVIPNTISLMPIAFNGQYWLGTVNNPQLYVKVLSISGFALLIGLAIMGSYHQAKSKYPSLWLLSFLLLIFAQVVVLGAGGARYFLPVFQVLVIYAVATFNLSKTKYFLLPLALISLLTSVSTSKYVTFGLTTHPLGFEKNAKNLITALHAKGIVAVYSLDALLQWQIMFYSNQTIKARWHNNTDRVQNIPVFVDSTYWNTPDKTAFVGYLPPFGLYEKYKEELPQQLSQVDALFFIYQNPLLEVLDYWNMRLNSRPSTQ